jgi:hypothetical protein
MKVLFLTTETVVTALCLTAQNLRRLQDDEIGQPVKLAGLMPFVVTQSRIAVLSNLLPFLTTMP